MSNITLFLSEDDGSLRSTGVGISLRWLWKMEVKGLKDIGKHIPEIIETAQGGKWRQELGEIQEIDWLEIFNIFFHVIQGIAQRHQNFLRICIPMQPPYMSRNVSQFSIGAKRSKTYITLARAQSQLLYLIDLLALAHHSASQEDHSPHL